MRVLRRSAIGAFSLVIFALVLSAGAAEDQPTGTIKGTITVGGAPTSDVVVTIEGIPPQKAPAAATTAYYQHATLAQRDLKFSPYVLPVLVGATVSFPNEDRAIHNVYSTSTAKRFDLGIYKPGTSKDVTFDKPGIVRVACNVHPTMEAFIVVEEHPYFVSPDHEGNYRFSDVPMGRYRLSVWHPVLGTRTEPFTLESYGEVLRVDIDLKK